jgi:fatty acid desaturase
MMGRGTAMKKWNNPWTRAVVAMAIGAAVAVAFVVVWAVRGAWVLFALELAIAVVACVVLGVFIEKRAEWLWQKVQFPKKMRNCPRKNIKKNRKIRNILLYHMKLRHKFRNVPEKKYVLPFRDICNVVEVHVLMTECLQAALVQKQVNLY